LCDQTLLELQTLLPGEMVNTPLTDLRNKLGATPGNDPNFIRLTAEFEDPALAAEIVNKRPPDPYVLLLAAY